MPPKFLSSVVAHTWDDTKREPVAPSRNNHKTHKRKLKHRTGSEDVEIKRITAAQLLDLGAADRFSERTTKQLRAEAPTLKRKKDVNIKVHLEQARESKRQDMEQRVRDEEIAGGRAIIKRTKKKRVRERGPSLHTDGDAKFRDGVLFVSKKTIHDTTTSKKHKSAGNIRK